MSAADDNEGMDVEFEFDFLTPDQLLHELLQSDCKHTTNVKEGWGGLRITNAKILSNELKFLKNLTPLDPQQHAQATACGITLYSLDDYPAERVLELKKRASRLYFERDFYSDLYDEMINVWKDEEETELKKVILSGNAGIGKSWFQVYVLRRLLTATPADRLNIRFVVRQVGSNDFSLIDLETSLGYDIEGEEKPIKKFLSGHGNILYLYEPSDKVNKPPLAVETPCLSTLSPRQNKIKEYLKEEPHELYMPVGEYNELECIAEEEKLDLEVLERNFEIFGGIFRYALYPTNRQRKRKKKKVDARCDMVTARILRSIAADVDDDPEAPEGNISGFVLSYTDIARGGEEAFRSPGLTLTSRYVRQRVMDKMSLSSYHDHLKMLAQVLNEESKDPTGKDLEESVVHMLSVGPKTVGWQYQGVPGESESDTSIRILRHTKRQVNREEFDARLVNYPKSTSYPLTDCVLVINHVYWAFQTTWQYDHAFKLSTLRLFRDNLGISIQTTVNILFVNPSYTEVYARRPKEAYLAKGESLSKPILDSKKRVLMSPADITTMWNNTQVFVAYPRDKDWHRAIRSVLGINDL